MNSLGISSAVDHFETIIKAVNYRSSLPASIPYVSLFMFRLGTHSKAWQLDICLKYITFATCAYKVKIVYVLGARNQVLCLPCLTS